MKGLDRFVSHFSACTFLGWDELCDCGYKEFVARVEGAEALIKALRQALAPFTTVRKTLGVEMRPDFGTGITLSVDPHWSTDIAWRFWEAAEALLGDAEPDEWHPISSGPHTAEASTVSFENDGLVSWRIENVKGGLQLLVMLDALKVDERLEDRVTIALEIGESKATLEGVVRERTDDDRYIIAVMGGTLVVQPVASEAPA